MVRFICKKCGYRLKTEKIPERCPYCGEEEVITEEQDAQELINES